MNVRDAWRWPLRSRARLLALVLAAVALALITKAIRSNPASTATTPGASPATAAAAATTGSPTTASTTPTAVPTNPDECVAQWAKGPDRDACLYRTYGYTPTADPTSTRGPASSTPPVVIGIPLTTATVDGEVSGYLPEADQAAALEVTARFVDAWYAGGSDQAWRDTVARWADPTVADQLPGIDRDALPGSRRIGQPAMRAFQPGLASTGVTTNNGSLAVTVIHTDTGWRVVTVTTEAP